jgi:hypothetical protein
VLKNHYADTPVAPGDYASCACFQQFYTWRDTLYQSDREHAHERVQTESPDWPDQVFHVDPPHHSQRAWDIACEILDHAAKRGVEELNLGLLMDRPDYMSLTTLPDSIGNLKDLTKLVLYGSNLSCLPRSISGCSKLKLFEPYTSYRLHWFPYELKKCRKLAKSCISTRALYGNYKLRAPFPDLTKLRWTWPTGGDFCSVCEGTSRQTQQYWISQLVGTDVIPLLVSVCSEDCLDMAGRGADGYVSRPHKGGLSLVQPSRD